MYFNIWLVLNCYKSDFMYFMYSKQNIFFQKDFITINKQTASAGLVNANDIQEYRSNNTVLKAK